MAENEFVHVVKELVDAIAHHPKEVAAAVGVVDFVVDDVAGSASSVVVKTPVVSMVSAVSAAPVSDEVAS